ncbi:MAG: hypothetical protein EOP35_21795 [Rubrivivax sp.]|nr:MAG: hypothetical protein EOP35_21795 [Rubrivivax sp.]
MKSVFSDPVQWAASAVGTKARFAVTLAMLALLVALAVFDASESGIRSAAAISLFLVWVQFLLLFGLRAVYLKTADRSGGNNDAASQETTST